ncbi:MAG: YeeE/YedE family protein, partial [Limnohabitans sp.]|nr:YeeE/YedE family protein [Limnohabitans sp.]
MNLASLLETWGDSNVLALAGALVGFIFGLAAQRTRFCARAAVVECCEGQTGDRFSVWWLAFGAALVGVQVLVWAGGLKPSDARYIGATGTLSGAVLGGLLFGAGMILTRGCASRLLILSANGNLRALLAGLVFAVTVQASIAGWLAPARQALASWWPIDGGPGRDLLHITGIGPTGGLVLALIALGTGFYFFFKTHQRRWGLALGAIITGLSIALGWGLTQAIASQSFEAVQIQGLSFSSASAEMLMRVLSS